MGVTGAIVSLGSIKEKTKSIHTYIYLRTYLAEFSFNYQIYKYIQYNICTTVRIANTAKKCSNIWGKQKLDT